MKNNPSIAIVGNSPCILEHEWGEEIDSHDIVVRFNRFKTEGFEKYCGIKTDLWIISWYWKPQSNFYLSLNPKNIILCPENNNINELKKHFIDNFGNTINFNDVSYIDYNKCTKCLMNKMGINKNPTTGFIGIEYLLQNYPNAKIDLYGFDFCKDLSNMHYYENYKQDYIYHDVHAEETYFWDNLSKFINYKK